MLSKLLWLVTLIVVAFLGYVALLPPVGTVTRSATLPASPDAIFANINELKKWESWSPWAKIDPNAKMTYEGPAAGVGSSFAWAGNSEVGEGKLTITESVPAKSVKYKLDFKAPMEGVSDAELSLSPDSGGTKVTWSMTGERPFVQRIFCVLFQADKMVGDMFDKGLANLGAVASGKAPAGA